MTSIPAFNAVVSEDDERAPLWRSITGKPELPIDSPISHYHTGHQAYIYRLDMTRLTPYQRRKVIARIAERDGLTTKRVAHDARLYGIGLNAEGITTAEATTPHADGRAGR